MTFKHIFSTGYLAEVEIDTSSFNQVPQQLAFFLVKLRKMPTHFPSQELAQWLDHVANECYSHAFINPKMPQDDCHHT